MVYKDLLALRECDEEMPKQKQKRAQTTSKGQNAAQSPAEFLAAQEAQAAAQEADAAKPASTDPTDVTATPQEVLDESMDSAESVAASEMMCLMLSEA